MNAVERTEKGLDRNGYMKAWNRLEEENKYNKSIIMHLVEKDCLNSNLTMKEYLVGFKIDGKDMSVSQARVYIRHFEAIQEIGKENFKIEDGQPMPNLKELEALSMLPSSAEAYNRLIGSNPKQKLKNYEEVKEAVGSTEPSITQIREFNKAKREAKEKYEAFKKEKTVKSLPEPDPFTYEEELDFETWCLKVHNFDIMSEKPKQTRAVYALKDEKVSVLFNRLDEWKSAYKMMAKLCHPDKGGNSLAMSFLSDFKELMDSLKNVQEIIDYENKVEDLRREYSTPSVP